MTDLEFAQLCASGDKHTWDQFIERYSRLIYSALAKAFRIHGCAVSQETLNDLFQEILLILLQDNFKKLKTFKARNGCSLAGWLRQITLHYAVDYMRKLKPALSLDAQNEEGASLHDALPNDAPLPTEIISDEEKVRQLTECIEALGQEDKYFLEMHLNQGVSLEIMATHLNIPRGAADTRKYRIIQRLRDCFKKKGFLSEILGVFTSL